jgi:ribosomal protein S18 acetylase RimI-like enzyme
MCVLAGADDVVGFGIVTQAEGEAELDSLHVLPRWRGQGLGRSLVIALAQRLSQGGQSTMRVTVVKENQRARSFYERLGAQYEGMWPAPWAPQHAIEEAVYRWTDLDQLLAQSGEPFG